MNQKFHDGDIVKYQSQGIMESMRATIVVGFNGVKENKWARAYCPIAKMDANRMTSSGPKENVYIVEHFSGWNPRFQPEGAVNPDVSLNQMRKYCFVFESELTKVNAQYPLNRG